MEKKIDPWIIFVFIVLAAFIVLSITQSAKNKELQSQIDSLFADKEEYSFCNQLEYTDETGRVITYPPLDKKRIDIEYFNGAWLFMKTEKARFKKYSDQTEYNCIIPALMCRTEWEFCANIEIPIPVNQSDYVDWRNGKVEYTLDRVSGEINKTIKGGAQ